MSINTTSSLFRFPTRRPVTVLMIVIALVVFGWVSYGRLSLDLMPDISYPTLTVRTEYPSAAPEEVESVVSRPLEQELGVVSNLVRISSISKAGLSDVILEFAWDTDMSEATQEIREKIDRTDLPDDVEKPLVLRYDPTLDPILRLALYGKESLYRMRRLAEEDVRRELESLPGVAAVKVKGGLEEEIHVSLEESALTSLHLDITQVNARLAQENINLAGGNLEDGSTEYLVRTLNEFQDMEEIANLVVAERMGREIRIRDFGSVSRGHKERDVITRVDGLESVEIDIYKEADANIVTVARDVRRTIFGRSGEPRREDGEAGADGEEPAAETASGAEDRHHPMQPQTLADRLPEDVEIRVIADQSGFIEQSINEVRNTAVLGGILAILVLFFFLRKYSTTVIVGLSIPISILATFAPMHIFGVSLNIMSLGGLALGVGMLVDNSIVVLESIFRCREEGDGILEAAVRGVGEVGSAVIASTLTTIAVFLPIVFVEGIAGQIFGDLSLTVVFALITSLLVALFFIPMLASRGQSGWRDRPITTYRTAQQLDEALSAADDGGLPWYRRLWINLRLIPLLAAEFVWKLLLILLSAVSLILKTTFLLLTVLAVPILILLGLLRRGKRGSAPALWQRFYTWTESPVFLRIPLFERCWEGIVSLKSATALREGTARLRAFCRRGGIVIRILKWTFCFIPGLLTIFVRFLFHLLVVEIIGRTLRSAILLIVVAVVFILRLLGMLFQVIAAPVMPVLDLGLGAVYRVYPRAIRFCLAHRAGVLVLLLAIVAGTVWMARDLDTELIPQVHRGEFDVNLELPVGTPLEETDQVTQMVEQRLATLEQVDYLSSAAGVELTATSSSDEGEHTSAVTVNLQPARDLELAENRAIGEIRTLLRDIPRLGMRIEHPALFSFRTPLEVEVHGHDLDTLKRLSGEVAAAMAEVDGIRDVKAYLKRGNPEVRIRYDRERLALYGLDIFQVASLVRNKVLGETDTHFREEEKRIDIRVMIRRSDTDTVGELRQLVVNPGAVTSIRLEDVASVEIAEGPSEIRRISQSRAALITANISGAGLGSVTGNLQDRLKDVRWPRGFEYHISGQSQEMEVSGNSLRFALLLAIFLVYIVMASQFESLVHPLVILFSIPLALVGVVIALNLLEIPLSVVVFIGMIMLAGIVVNNAIILVDYVNQLRRHGMERDEALVTAGKRRIRPILMTTITTVLGLLPMALGLGEGAEIRMPLAITVIAGLISSTLLTLLIIPTIYSWFDGLGSLFGGRRRPAEAVTAHGSGGSGIGFTPPSGSSGPMASTSGRIQSMLFGPTAGMGGSHPITEPRTGDQHFNPPESGPDEEFRP